MNFLDLNYGNGFPFENKTIDFIQGDYQSALKGLAGLGGSGNFIISGLVQTGSNLTDGWIYLNGDLLFFKGGTKQATYIIEEITENKIYLDGVSHPAYITRQAKFGLGVTTYNFSDLKRLPNLLELQSIMTSIIGFETSVIIKGCEVSSVTTSPTTLVLSAGLVMIDDNILTVPGYSGVYPVWIDRDGNYVNVAPGAGSFIKFDPYASQGKESVIRRAVHRTGDVIMSAVLSDRFDSTGLGRWEMQGFARMNGANGTFDIRGRSPLSFDGRGSDPGGGIWDANYQALGNTGGEKNHALSIAEMPAHTHTNLAKPSGKAARGSADTKLLRPIAGPDEGVADDYPATDSKGGGDPHNNTHPYMILAFAQRI